MALFNVRARPGRPQTLSFSSVSATVRAPSARAIHKWRCIACSVNECACKALFKVRATLFQACTHRHGHTDIQTHIHTYIHTDIQTDGQTDRYRERQRETGRQTDRQAARETAHAGWSRGRRAFGRHVRNARHGYTAKSGTHTGCSRWVGAHGIVLESRSAAMLTSAMSSGCSRGGGAHAALT